MTRVGPTLALAAVGLALPACRPHASALPQPAAQAAAWTRVRVAEAGGPYPSVSILVPRGAQRRVLRGDDTVLDEFTFGGHVVRLERWGINSVRCPGTDVCSATTEVVAGRGVRVLRRSGGDGARVLAFVPATSGTAEGPAVGLRFAGTCAPGGTCRDVLSALRSIAFD